nr:ribonuclease H-like domain-containing protein [Tanacetum cinerariifolium]
IVKPIDRLSFYTTSISPLPKSPFLALQNPHWNNAMHDEYNALVKNGTWILVPRPAGINLVRSMWLFKHKFLSDGTLSRYKARLVANGSSQQLEVFIGLKQAPRASFQRFAGYATRATYLLIHVDDIILTSSSTYLLQQVITSLHNEFDMTDLGALNYFLGISATRHSTGLFLSQKQYAIELLARAHMTNCTLQEHQLIRTPNWVLKAFQFSTPLYIAVLQSSKRQQTISRSSAEAEYRGVANVVAETAWLCNLLRELHSSLSATTLVYCDNVSTTYLSVNPYADIFTKGLPSALFENFYSSLSVRLPPARTAGAY